METLIMVGQLLLGLSILVGLHELGHLLTAKMFGMRVEKFSIGFPPKIAGFQWGETEYSIGAIPLGGFVKISGMVDESMDSDQMAGEPQPWEFRSKPAWQRLIVMLGGIIVNVVTGIIIFWVMVYNNGETYFSRDQVIENGIVAYEYGESIGLKTGDKILDVNGVPYKSITELTGGAALLADNGYYTVDRGGEILKVEIPRGFINTFNSQEAFEKFVSIRIPFEVGEVDPKGGAQAAGLRPGDKILAINGQEIRYFDQLQASLKGVANQTAEVVRQDGTAVDTLTVAVSDAAKIGFAVQPLIEPVRRKYGIGESFVEGTSRAFGIVVVNAKAIGKMFTGDVSPKNVSSFVGMAKMYGPVWNWAKFWSLTGLISMLLAFMNLLPIPALDGGHVMFLLYEMISGRAPSDKFLENAQKVGMVILLALMVFAIGNDILKLFN
jgi:regulator of sigma E protease